MQAVKRLSEIDKDDDTTSSFDLETFDETPKAKNDYGQYWLWSPYIIG